MNAIQEAIRRTIQEYEVQREDHRALVRVHEARVEQLDEFIAELESLEATATAKPATTAKTKN
jgi:hypothetical protein